MFFDYKLFGLHWPAYHLQSIALHIANAVLIYFLANDLGLGKRQGWAGAVLFSAAPLTFEAVLWPAARFDLLATFFILLTLRVVIKCLKKEGAGFLDWASAGGLYALALLNKESAYCVPLLVLFLMASGKTWGIARADRRNATGLLAALGVVTAVMLSLRFALYHNLGGYATPMGESAHAHFGFKTISSLFTRVFAIGLFTANLSAGISLLLGIGLLLFVISLVVIVVSGVKITSVEMGLLALVLISALPTLNIIGWIGVNAQQSRYLYLPGIWLMLLFARFLYMTDWPVVTLVLLLAANVSVSFSDLGIYKDMLRRTVWLADDVRARSLQTNMKQVVLLDLPPEANGVFFFRDELAREIYEKLPGAEVTFDTPLARNRPALWFDWDAGDRTLVAVPGVRVNHTLR